MRYLLLTASLAAAVVFCLTVRGDLVGSLSSAEPKLLVLAVPATVVEGERVSLYGGIDVPSGSFELGTYACQGGSCARSLWRRVEGPDQVWAGLGSVMFDAVGVPATVELRVFQADDLRERVVASWRRPVMVTSTSAEAPQLEELTTSRAKP